MADEDLWLSLDDEIGKAAEAVLALSQDRLDGDGLQKADPWADIRNNRRIRTVMQVQ